MKQVKYIGHIVSYRKFIQNFSEIARPLIDVMATGKKLRGNQAQSTEWIWGKEQIAAFEALKGKLTTPPILGYSDFSLPFELHRMHVVQGSERYYNRNNMAITEL